MEQSCRARCALVTAALVVSTAAHANHYVLVDAGPLLYGAVINENDDIAGTSQHGLPLLWNGDHWHKLAKQPADVEAINAGGDVVGLLGSGEYQAVLWPAHQPMRVLTMPGDAPTGYAYGINDAGAVVGAFNDRNDPGNHCFLWTEAAGSIDLGFKGLQGLGCGARAINEQGQITGDASSHGYQRPHAFRYENGRFKDLGTLTPGNTTRLDFSTGVAINNQGDIVGYSNVPPVEKHNEHAVVWRGTTIIDLNRDTSYVSSEALGINDNGVIVGTAKDVNKRQCGVRFTDPGVVQLDSEVDNLGRWHVLRATGVNQLGDIVAEAVGPKGDEHAVILRIESTD